ncbi:hypothetical protein FB451DRAFT_1366381 [Mycena latifolia]|nr:hypothetical protein FB451DRAFT_1366381 [Mycena latifolia]
MSLFASIPDWDSGWSRNSVPEQPLNAFEDEENENPSQIPRSSSDMYPHQTPRSGEGVASQRAILGPSNSGSFTYSSPSITPGPALPSSQTQFQGGFVPEFSDLTPGSASVLGRRKRLESLNEWSPPTKARLRGYAGEVAGEFGVPESNREEFITASMLPTHKLMIVSLAAGLAAREDDSSEVKLKAYLVSGEFKDNVISQIRGVLLDPKLPSYKTGFLDRLMRHIRLNPGVYRIPQEFRAMITTRGFQGAMLAAWNAKACIYDLVKSLAWKSSQEMTDAIWARFAWVQMKLIDYKTGKRKDDEFWDYIDKELSDRRAKTLTLPLQNRAAFSSYIFEEALKNHLQRCKPKKKKKSRTQLPNWQQEISRTVEEMEGYTLEELAEEEELTGEGEEEVDGNAQASTNPCEDAESLWGLPPSTDLESAGWSQRRNDVGPSPAPTWVPGFGSNGGVASGIQAHSIKTASIAHSLLILILPSALMAEALGTLASVLQLVDTILKAREYFKDFHDAPKDQKKLFSEMEGLKALLMELDKWVMGNPSSEAFSQMVGPLATLKTMMEHVTEKLGPVDGQSKLTKRLSWTLWSKKEVAGYLEELERIKVLINLWLTMDIWDVGQKQMSNQDSILNTVQEQKDIIDAEKRQKILDWMSPLNFLQRQADVLSALQPGTGEWLLSDTVFQDWEAGSGKVLFCHGIPGAGKTVLVSLVVNHLEAHARTTDIGLACIYLNHKETETQTITNLLGGLWRQLMLGKPISPTVQNLYDHHHERQTRPKLEEVCKALDSAVAQYSKVFIVIDAVDEYPDHHRHLFLKYLVNLLPQTSILMTSRPHINLEAQFPNVKTIEIRATEQDLQKYLDTQIQDSVRLSKHIQTRPKLRDEILSKIVENAKGMFLLAKLHIQSLITKNTIKAVREALQHMPKDLQHTYDEAMERIGHQTEEDRQLGLLALTWVANAKRPLSVAELQEALAIEPESTFLDMDNLLDVDIILSACAGLIIVDDSVAVVRLIHYTTQDYLDSIQSERFPLAHSMIVSTCLTYLSFPQFEVLPQWREHQKRVDLLIAHPFLKYAEYCLTHAKGDPEDSLQDKLVAFLTGASRFIRIWNDAVPWKGIPEDYYFPPLCISAACDLEVTMRQLLAQGIAPKDMDAALCAASFNGHTHLVQLLIDAGVKIKSQDDYYGHPLTAASENGHESVVQLLIEKGADVNAQGGDYGNALQAASLNGHESVVQRLIEKGADVNAQGGYLGNALQAASVHGHESMVQLLIEKGVDVNAQGGYFGNALQAASTEGHGSVAQLLIKKGANVNAQGGHFGNSLQAASCSGHESVVQLLIEKGADVNAQGGHFGNALQAASHNGHESVIQLLIKKGADLGSGRKIQLPPEALAAIRSKSFQLTSPSPTTQVAHKFGRFLSKYMTVANSPPTLQKSGFFSDPLAGGDRGSTVSKRRRSEEIRPAIRWTRTLASSNCLLPSFAGVSGGLPARVGVHCCRIGLRRHVRRHHGPSTSASPPSSLHAARIPSGPPRVSSPRSRRHRASQHRDLLSAPAQLAGANAQLVTAKAQPAALQAEFDTVLRARRAPRKKGQLDDGVRGCVSSLLLFSRTGVILAAVPSPSARPLPRATCADVLPRASRHLICPCTTARRETSPHSHSYFYIPAVLPTALNTSPPSVLSLPVHVREDARSRRFCRAGAACVPHFPARSESAPSPSSLTPPTQLHAARARLVRNTAQLKRPNRSSNMDRSFKSSGDSVPQRVFVQVGGEKPIKSGCSRESRELQRSTEARKQRGFKQERCIPTWPQPGRVTAQVNQCRSRVESAGTHAYITFKSAAEFNREYGGKDKYAPKELSRIFIRAKTRSGSCGLGDAREAEARVSGREGALQRRNRIRGVAVSASGAWAIGVQDGGNTEIRITPNIFARGIRRGVRVQPAVERQSTALQHEREDFQVGGRAEHLLGDQSEDVCRILRTMRAEGSRGETAKGSPVTQESKSTLQRHSLGVWRASRANQGAQEDLNPSRLRARSTARHQRPARSREATTGT